MYSIGFGFWCNSKSRQCRSYGVKASGVEGFLHKQLVVQRSSAVRVLWCKTFLVQNVSGEKRSLLLVQMCWWCNGVWWKNLLV